MKLSVIVPVYNVEKYLPQCLESIIGQNYNILEIILVNDGSTDESADICDRFAKQDSRISVIHQENAGVSAARNAGIAFATGDYITFVDSDDWLSPLMYEDMLKAVSNQNQPDLVMCDFINERPASSEKITTQIRCGYYSKTEIVTELYPTLLVTDDLGRLPIVSVCNCLFKASLLKKSISFATELRYSEDYLFMAEVMIAAQSFYYAKDRYHYHYRQYDESRSKKYQLDWWPVHVQLNKKLQNLLSERAEYDFTYQLKLQLMHSAMFLTNTIYTNTSLSVSEKAELIQKICNDPDLEKAFKKFTFEKQSWPLRTTLYFLRFKQAKGYLLYRNLMSKIKNN